MPRVTKSGTGKHGFQLGSLNSEVCAREPRPFQVNVGEKGPALHLLPQTNEHHRPAAPRERLKALRLETDATVSEQRYDAAIDITSSYVDQSPESERAEGRVYAKHTELEQEGEAVKTLFKVYFQKFSYHYEAKIMKNWF